MYKYILYVLIIIISALLQISLLSHFSFFVYYINILLVLIIFLTLIKGQKIGLLFAITSGFVVDIYSPFWFGLITISLATPVIIVHNLFKNFLARKSIYSLLVLAIISNIFYFLVFLLLGKISFWLGLNDYDIIFDIILLKRILYQIFFNTILALLLFTLYKIIINSFKSRFIVSEQS